jgi:hypothetical protein
MLLLKIVRFSLLFSVILVNFVVEEAAAEANPDQQVNPDHDQAEAGRSRGCSLKDGVETCSKSNEPKSRKKRVVSLPNLTSISMQSRLIVPQPPVGLYMVWFRLRMFVRPMFTESTVA